jgi:uncharacterized membrane protein YqjE
MESNSTASGHFLSSLRSLGYGLLTILKDRVELVSIELQEEKFRLIQIFIWISAAVFTAFMTIAFASLTLVYAFWESARLAVLGGLSILYGAALVVIILSFRRYLERQPKPFAGSLEELEEDRACIQPEN